MQKKRIKNVFFSLRFVFSVFFCTTSDADKERRSAFQFQVQKVILIGGWYEDSSSCSPLHPNSLTLQSSPDYFRLFSCSKLSSLTLLLVVTLLSQSQSQSHIATDGQSVSTSWCRAQSGTFDQSFFFQSYGLVFFFWEGAALSDERSDLSCVSLCHWSLP
jgi:hypothetical protein